MDARTPIKKMFFISVTRKAIITEDKILVCDEKNKIVKEFNGVNADLLKVKDKPFIAYVEHRMAVPRDPKARRNALIHYEGNLPGETTIFAIENLEQPFLKLPYAMTHLLMFNEKIISLSGIQIIIYHHKEKNSEIYPAWFISHSHHCLALGEPYFMVFQKDQVARVLYERDDGDEVHGYGVVGKYFHMKSACALGEEHLLTQNKRGYLQIDHIVSFKKINLIKNKKVSVLFKDLILLPGGHTILGLTDTNDLYLIEKETLQIKKLLRQATKPILEIVMTENDHVIAMLNDSSYFDVGAFILKHSITHEILLKELTLPLVLNEMIINYEADFGRFFSKLNNNQIEKTEVFKKNVL